MNCQNIIQGQSASLINIYAVKARDSLILTLLNDHYQYYCTVKYVLKNVLFIISFPLLQNAFQFIYYIWNGILNGLIRMKQFLHAQ